MDVETTSTISTSCGSKKSFYKGNWYYCAFQQNSGNPKAVMRNKSSESTDNYGPYHDSGTASVWLERCDGICRKVDSTDNVYLEPGDKITSSYGSVIGSNLHWHAVGKYSDGPSTGIPSSISNS